MENGNEFLTASDVGRILSVSKQSTNAWMNAGQLKFFQVGHTRRVRKEDLIEYLEGLQNSLEAMAGFKRDIANYLWMKYRDEKYLKEAEIQSELFEKYNAQRSGQKYDK